MRNVPFTARQGQLLAFVHCYTARRGISPSYEEIGAHLGTSSPSVNGMVKSLERKGLLSRIPGKARTLRVEVPSAMLPTSDFGSRRAVQPDGHEHSTPAVDAAVAAAIAVLDQVRASLLVEVDRDSAARWLDSIGTHLARALVKVAVAPEDAAEAARLVQAEIARWVPQKQGLRVERRRWARRR